MGSRPGPGDDELVLLSKDGSIAAFNSLVERYQTQIYNLCYRLLGNREAAEDATQETFLSAYRALPRFVGGNFRSWLFRIAANGSKDELRRRRRKPVLSIEALSDPQEAPLEFADASESAEARVERIELGDTLRGALQLLPFDQRQAIVLLDVYGYRYEEIAVMTSASLGTVKSRIHRGRERLRRTLGGQMELLLAPRRLDS
jgi:RNA polymerase sigma-70 factor (ECF subfamily)